MLQMISKLNDTDFKAAATKSLLRHEPQMQDATLAATRERRIRTISDLTSDDWKDAAAHGHFMEIPSKKLRVHHTIYSATSSDEPVKCGEPCVAHCIAGQPREMISVKGLWKSIKHRLFEQMSESPHIFAALALGAVRQSLGQEGAMGYVREAQSEVPNEDLLPSLDYLGVKRALFDS